MRKGKMKNAAMVILAGCLWGVISIFVRQLNALGITAMECVAIRTTITAIILCVFLLARDPRQLRVRARDLPLFAASGLGSVLFFSYSYFKALEVFGGAAMPALLLYTAPVFVMIFSALLFHEKWTKQKAAVLVLTFTGLVLVTGAFNGLSAIPVTGVLFGMGAAVGYALYSIFGKLIGLRGYSPAVSTFYTFVFASAGAVPLSGILADWPRLMCPAGVGAALGIAFISTTLPFFFYTRGLMGLEAGRASVLASSEPITAVLVGLLVFHESFTIAKILGMVLVLSGIVLINFEPKRRKRPPH
ncbi:DMT family transporter [uncultured Pseudoramibacter sp.]|uniref:DMT family transporter n=1 Tax=uncultured Pseudoramibacter sp. TaxID=1623493 RepID=UPI0025E3B799|nr:DMT family transporter [uncultured Pseudoramibacter sp.]